MLLGDRAVTRGPLWGNTRGGNEPRSRCDGVKGTSRRTLAVGPARGRRRTVPGVAHPPGRHGRRGSPVLADAPSTATTLLSTIVGASVGLAGFVVTATVLAIQMATGTFSARYMRTTYRDHLLHATLAFLAGTLTFSFALLRQVSGKQVPNIGVNVAGLCLVASLVLFLLFFGRLIHRLRPVAVATLVGQLAKRVITTVTQPAETEITETLVAPRGDPALTVASLRVGAIPAINLRRPIKWASEHDAFLVMKVGVGDSVAAGQTVIAVDGGGTSRRGPLANCVGCWRWGWNGPSSRIQPSQSGSWWMSPSRLCPQPSTTPPQPCRP